jgi:Zn-dependent metalloprotease
MKPCIHSILCILPPHILRNIAESQQATDAQRQKALQTMEISAQFRAQRRLLTEVKEMAVKTLTVQKERVVYNAQNGTNLPGTSVRSEGDPPTGDAATDEAYDYSGNTYDYYSAIHNRNSIDGNGMRLDSTVHYDQGYDNAFWNGQQMVYGDGDEDLPPDQRLFNRFTISLSIVGHELAHGVTQHEAGLVYFSQSGALNESMSDVFGTLVRQWTLNQTAAEADWLVGEGLFTENVNGVAIRSLKAPGTAYNDPVLGKDPQPAHMDNYQNVSYDNGGVHINSGIPNHAFYRAAVEIGGYAWEKMGHIWYMTLKDKLQSLHQFADAAQLTYQTAGELYGVGSLEQKAVQTGWNAVGLSVVGGKGCLSAIFGAK